MRISERFCFLLYYGFETLVFQKMKRYHKGRRELACRKAHERRKIQLKSILYCRMEASGQEVYRLVLPWSEAAPEKNEIHITGFYKEEQGLYVKSVKGVS